MPLQVHLRNKSAKEPSAKDNCTAQCQTDWHHKATKPQDNKQ